MRPVSRGIEKFRLNLFLWPMLYVVKLVLALLVALPLYVLTGYMLERSVFADPLASRWATSVLFELVRTQDKTAISLGVVLLFIAALAFLIKQFLNGGLYYAYMRSGKAPGSEFWAEAAGGFRDHIVISLIMIPVYLLFLAIGSTLSGVIPTTLFGNFSGEILLARVVRWLVLAAFLIMAVVISEAMRLHRTAMPNARWRDHFSGALAFMQSSGVRMYRYYWLYFLPFLAIWAMVEWLAIQVTGGLGNTAGVVIELLLFQVCAFIRTGQSLLFTATAAPLLVRWKPGRFIARQTELALG